MVSNGRKFSMQNICPVIDKQRKLLYNFQMKHIDLFGQKDVVLYILCFSCCQTKLPFKRAEERKKYI